MSGAMLKFEDAGFKRDFNGIVALARNPEKVMLASGRELANQLKKHFRKKDEENPNHLSDRRVHYWLRVGKSVNNPVMESPTVVSVTIADPTFAQKLFGGVIRAKNAGALTIPVEERAYGRAADTFERETGLTLFLVKIGGTAANGLENAVLAIKDPADPKHITVEYLLTKSVDQKADPTALPLKADLEKAIIARGQRVLDRELKNPTDQAGSDGSN